MQTPLEHCTVLYRSKEPTLPDFSQGDDDVSDVSFDVGSFIPSLFFFSQFYFLKPNVLATDGSAVMTICRFSPCGKYFAYAISRFVGVHVAEMAPLFLVLSLVTG
jgi:hypothetical protein